MSAGEKQEKIPPALEFLLHSGELILTPNQRAARALRQAFDAQQQTPTWSPANVLALDTWLDSLWSRLLVEGHETRLLLNRTQEHALWQQIIAADPEVPGLRSPHLLADMAAQAWSELCRHNGRARLREFGLSTDTRAFQRWAQLFERRLRQEACLSSAQLPEALASTLAEGTLDLPASGLTLLDFDQSTPAIDLFFESSERAGYPVRRVNTALSGDGHCFAAQDELDELTAIARWCRLCLDDDPNARIAIVAPDLQERRAAIERVFADVLTPASQSITAAPSAPLYEFSLGVSLANTAPCAVALALLRWSMLALPVEAIGTLLLSPFVAGPDALAAADFDAHTLRRVSLLRPELTLAAFVELAALPRRGPRLAVGLLTRLRALLSAARQLHLDTADRQQHAGWADAFRDLLTAAGWTELAARDSLSYQARERWESTLDELATLDFTGQPVTASEALETLARLASQTIFAPESLQAPIQILGPLELGGLPFDHLWLLGADDLTWPPTSNPTPLIPFAVQQSLGIPAADPHRQRLAARALTARIAGSAPHFVVSFTHRDEHGEHRLSPFVAELSLPPYLPPFAPAPPAPISTERFADILPIGPLPDTVIEGGASILQAQAACAFRAFAEKRLRSAAPEPAETGLDARDRGSDVHQVMEHFWSELQHQEALLALAPDERDSLLDECIDAALARHTAHSAWDHAYLAVQRERLRRLLRPWLQVEAARPPFLVLNHERTEHDLAIGPLRLSLRVDRVDETEGGNLILDYKTGEASPSQWLTDRPEQPQLPLYAALAETPPAGVAFALLRAGEDLCLKGFSSEDTVLAKGPYKDMALQLEEWRQVLTTLAKAFAAGEAKVAPRCYPKTCGFCTQRILCRLDPTTLDDIGDEDSDAETELANA